MFASFGGEESKMKEDIQKYFNENCEMAIAISSSRADSASVPGVVFKWFTQAHWAET